MSCNMLLTYSPSACNSDLPDLSQEINMSGGETYMKKILGAIVILGMFGQSVPLWASAGTEGASFLDIPVGAGPASLGSAYTALATNAYAPVWNPAGLGMLNGNEVAAQHLSYLDSMHYEFMSFVHPFDQERGSDVHRGV